MRYVAYHKMTTRYLCKHPKTRTKKESFATYAAAQAAITREHNNGAIDKVDFLIAEAGVFHSAIEKSEMVHNLTNGAPIKQSVNTPLCLDPSSETYWSM